MIKKGDNMGEVYFKCLSKFKCYFRSKSGECFGHGLKCKHKKLKLVEQF